MTVILPQRCRRTFSRGLAPGGGPATECLHPTAPEANRGLGSRHGRARTGPLNGGYLFWVFPKVLSLWEHPSMSSLFRFVLFGSFTLLLFMLLSLCSNSSPSTPPGGYRPSLRWVTPIFKAWTATVEACTQPSPSQQATSPLWRRGLLDGPPSPPVTLYSVYKKHSAHCFIVCFMFYYFYSSKSVCVN